MNVRYDSINTEDAATMLGVSKKTITNWCRDRLIDFTDLSDGTHKARYMFDIEELNRVQQAMALYGKYKWARHVHTERKAVEVAKQNEVIVNNKEDVTVEVNTVSAKEKENEKILLLVDRIRDFKEELENLECRRKQVEGEIDLLRKELNELI
ncbi:MAG: helix-turn-helix domain-containing protein [Clostridiales bacterium]|nr:helix-turn-helix domain-containing protein [Clostridiales bacterium]